MRASINECCAAWRTEIATVCSVSSPTFAERVITRASEIERSYGKSEALRAAVTSSLDYYRRSSIVLMSVDRATKDARSHAEARLAELVTLLEKHAD